MKKTHFMPLLTMVCLLLCGCGEAVEGSVMKPSVPTATARVTETAVVTTTAGRVTTTAAKATTEPTPSAVVGGEPDGVQDERPAKTNPPTKNKPTEKPTVGTFAPNTVAVSSNGYEIKTTNGITTVDGVLVVNKTYSLPASYNTGDLTPDCDRAYMSLKAAAKKAGHSLYISSGFRDYDTQDILYRRYVANDGKANADRYSARPGNSEHQTGLAIDLNGVSDSFGNTPAGKWVAAHCHEYGFILRYPQGKEAQTGYMYEPWHIRYVGKSAAGKIAASGLCLEEYYGITSAYPD